MSLQPKLFRTSTLYQPQYWLQLAKYDPCKTKKLIEGFNGGFTLHYDGPEESSFSKNHLSVQENFSVAQEKNQK